MRMWVEIYFPSCIRIFLIFFFDYEKIKMNSIRKTNEMKLFCCVDTSNRSSYKKENYVPGPT